jgi:thiamine biosynthesis lipoprotein
VIRVEDVMGTTVVVDLRDDDVADSALDDVFDWLRLVDETFSTYRPDSEISRLRRGELETADAHDDVRTVLARCAELRDETRGFFDAYAVGGVLDPSALVKGWSVDRAGGVLDRAGARNYTINAGGDVLARGRALPGGAWRVGIRHPELPDAVAKVVEAGDLAIATSGTYERGAHILDPHTGAAPAGVLSVTVTGPELGTADAYATAAFAMGVDGPAWTARLRGGYEALTILADGRVLSTPRFPAAGA